MKREMNPIVMIVIGILGISLSSIFVKFSEAPSEVTAAYRLLFTVAFMTPVVFGKKDVRKELFSVSRKTFLLSAASGIFLAIHFATWFESLHHTTVAASTVIVCTEVVWVALGFCIFLKGKMSRKEIFAVSLALIGSVLITLTDLKTPGGSFYGDILSLIAAVAVGVYTLLGRVVRKSDVSTSVYTYIVYVFCAATLILFAVIRGNSLVGYGISGPVVGLLLAVFSTLLGHSIFSWCLKYFSPAFVSASKLLEPVISAVFALFIFKEIPGIFQVLGGLVILAGVVYYTLIEVKQES